MSQALQLKTPLLRIATRAWGPPDGKPVIALHGWLDNAASFDRLAPLLPDCRIYALDLPGHGRSQHRAKGCHYHFVDFATDVMAAVETLKLERFSLLGHSLGGGVACFVAAAIPNRVEQLISIEALGPRAHPEVENPDALRIATQQLIAPARDASYYATRQDAFQARAAVADFDMQCASILAARNLKRTPKGWCWRYDPALKYKSPIYLTEEQVLAHLRRITAPTLLLLGETGYHTEARLQQRAAAIPNLTCQMIPGGHHPHLEQPQTAAEAINAFLSL